MEASKALEASPDDTAPQSAVSLLDLELLAALPPDAPSMPPPAWVIDEEDEPSMDDEDPVVPTPWRPQRGAFATALMVHVCFFLIALAGARTAYARFDAAAEAGSGVVTHRKGPSLDRIFVIREVGHRPVKTKPAPHQK